MENSYSKFAWFYDELQDQVKYDEMAKLFDGFIKRYSAENEVVVDLACGTGSLSVEMAKLGYDVYGVDSSEDMLNEALKKKVEQGLDIQYLCQDMTELDLQGASDVILCVMDSLNHLENFKDLRKTIRRVGKFTCEGGLFIFDVNTRYKHREILGNYAYNFDFFRLFCAWQNELGEDDSVKIYLDFFEKLPDGKYERYSECFTEYYYDLEEIEKLLFENKFEIIGRYDDFSENPICEKTQRVLFVCRKNGNL